MARIKVLYDTNILIDYLKGMTAARHELQRKVDGAVSVITWMEVMAGARPEEELNVRRLFLSIPVLSLSPKVAERAVVLRRERRWKLRDAIVYATADVEGRVLVTRDTKAFGADDPAIRVPYRV